MKFLEQLLAIFRKPPAEVTPAPKFKSTPKPTPPSAKPAEDRRRRKRINAQRGTRVLIIDDSPTVIAVLKKMLISGGYVVLEAPDAEQGLEIAHAEIPDLIFLDLLLPGMNGFAALRLIRRDPAIHTIPVIMMSGNEQLIEQFASARTSADNFMKKPFSRLDVFSRIEHLLDEKLVPRRRKLATAPAAPAPVPSPVPQD